MMPAVEALFDQRTQTLAYVVLVRSSRDAVVIDPVLDYEPVGSHTFTESVDRVTPFVAQREPSCTTR